MKYMTQNIAIIIFLTIYKLDAERIILPDDRVFDVPDQESYKYILHEESSSSLERLYVLLEVHSNSALLCPKGYSMLEIKQELVVNVNFSHLVSDVTAKRHSLSLLKPEGSGGNKIAPCPTIYDCLGYQACVFKYSYDFCLQDPAPSSRKALLLTIVCFRDDVNIPVPNFDKQKDFVLHIYYNSETDEDSPRDYSMTKIEHIEVTEKLIFSGYCSLPQIATQFEGYFGNCSALPQERDIVSHRLWTLLGRTKSKKCLDELKQVFCAFQYNNQGLCVPPIFHNKDDKSGRIYNFQALPKPDYRPQEVRYRQFLLQHYAELVPVRLAFIILVHQEAPATMELLHSIYRKQHLYVIHVDKRATTVREELRKMVLHSHFPGHNVFFLPPERSFETSWASYEIVRAQLEGFEELLRLGVWDFVINLSGSDLPLRSIDNLAMALAPHRGLSFFPFAQFKGGVIQPSGHLINTAFYACDGYVFNITSIPYIHNEDIQLYSAPQWGTFSRKFIQYLVDEKLRSPVFNKFQFYLQTHIVPDESYIVTALMNSPFRNSLHLASIHATKEFRNVNSDNLCRHALADADFCGQGPGFFSAKDIPELISLSHRSFFARKFHSNLSDDARKFVLEFVKQDNYEFFESYLPASVLHAVVEDAIKKFSVKKKIPHNILVLESILDLQVTPSLVPHQTCCRSKLISGLWKITDYNYWLDISVFNKINGLSSKARLMLVPTINSRICYRDGGLRMILVSPWKADGDNPYSHNRFGSDEAALLPYGPAYSNGVSVILVLARETENLNCTGSFSGDPLFFKDISRPVKVSLNLISPDKRLKCNVMETIVLGNEDNESMLSDNNEMVEFVKLHPITIQCAAMKPGLWSLQIMQVEPSRSKSYNFSIYLLDLQNTENLNAQLVDVLQLWELKHFAFISENYTFNFIEDEEIEKNYLLHQQEILDGKKIRQNKDTSNANKTVVVYSILKTYCSENWRWFICSGGIGSIAAVCLFLTILICCPKYRYHQKTIFFLVPSLVFATTLQVTVFIILCKE